MRPGPAPSVPAHRNPFQEIRKGSERGPQNPFSSACCNPGRSRTQFCSVPKVQRGTVLLGKRRVHSCAPRGEALSGASPLPGDWWCQRISYRIRVPAPTSRDKTSHHFFFEKAGHESHDTRENVTTIHYAGAIRFATVYESPCYAPLPPNSKAPSVGKRIIQSR